MSNTTDEAILLPTSSEPADPDTGAKPGRLCFGLLLLFITCLYAIPAQMFPALAAWHPAQIIAVSALGLLVIEKMTLHQSFVLIWPEGYLLLAFVGAAALSTFSAFWPLRAYEAAIDLLRILVAYLLIVNTVVTEKRLRAFMVAMIIGGLFPAIGTLNGYFHGDLVEGRAHWIGIFGNSNELAYILVMLVPLAAVLAGQSRFFLRILFWAAIALYVSAIYLTLSRGALLGLVGVMILLAIRQRGVILKLAMGVLLIGGLAYTGASWKRSDGAANQGYTFQQRIATIKAGGAMFSAHPLLGVGIDCAIVAFPLYAPNDFKAKGALVIHNTIIQALSETGVIGFIPFVLLILCGLYHARQVQKSESLTLAGRRMAVGLEVSLWGAMICGLSGGFLLSWFPYLVIGLIASTRQIAGAAVHE
jgi:O-antigen ligase